jgi:hypothetical protein
MCGLTTRERQTAASTAPMPHPRPGRRGQAPRPRSGAPKAKGLTAAIAVVAKSNVPSFALKFTCVEGPIGASDTPAIYTTLTDVTPRGVPRLNDRRVLNGIFWVLRSGAPWRDLPDDFGPYTTCYNRFVRWRRGGVRGRIMDALPPMMRRCK